jgi:hypothetical protein
MKRWASVCEPASVPGRDAMIQSFEPKAIGSELFDPSVVNAAWAAVLDEAPDLATDAAPLSERLRYTYDLVKREKTDDAFRDFGATMMAWAWRTRGGCPRWQQLDDWAASFMYYGGVLRTFGLPTVVAVAELQARAEELKMDLTALFPLPAREQCLNLFYAWWRETVLAAQSGPAADLLKSQACSKLQARCATLRLDFGESAVWRELRRDMVFAFAEVAPPPDGILPPEFTEALSAHDAVCRSLSNQS